MQNSRIRNILLLAGGIEVMVALLHFVMPYFTNQNTGFISLGAKEVAFINLLIYAVGILLLAFGSFTIYLANRVDSLIEVIYYYLMIKVALWSLRVALELIYPVQLKMFFIENFSVVVLPALVFELLLFCVALVFTAKVREVIIWDKSL